MTNAHLSIPFSMVIYKQFHGLQPKAFSSSTTRRTTPVPDALISSKSQHRPIRALLRAWTAPKPGLAPAALKYRYVHTGEEMDPGELAGFLDPEHEP